MEEDMQFVKLDVFFLNFICIMEEDMQSTKFSQTAVALLQKAKARANAGPPQPCAEETRGNLTKFSLTTCVT